MIIINLTGGLGNQMHQYAFGRYLAHTHNTTLKYHFTNALLNTQRYYELHIFRIQAEEATPDDLRRFGVVTNRQLNRILYLLDDRWGIQLNKHVVTQRYPYQFDPSYRSLPDDRYVQGYWADERYFQGVEDLLRTDFTLHTPLDDANQTIADAMSKTNSVSIHVRRGDYITNKANLPQFIGEEYYTRALADIHKKVHDPVYYIFSDDIPWCKTHFAHLANAHFISHNTGVNSYKDMILMSHCKHHIIANSTFSWWGRWLK